MKLSFAILLLSAMMILNCRVFAQATFSIKYHFRLFDDKGRMMTCDSLAKRALMISTPNGTLEKQSYDTLTHYFFVDIHTTLPELTFIWKRNDAKMYFNIDCPTEYKDIYLDSLYFKPGTYAVNNDCQKNVYYENDHARYIRFSDYSRYKKGSPGSVIYEKMIEVKGRPK